METILGVALGAIIIAGVFAWSFRHPLPQRPRNEASRGVDGTDVYGGWSFHHHTDHFEGSADSGPFDL